MLLAAVVIEQALLDAVHGFPALPSEVGQARPDQHGAGDVIALNARLAALVPLADVVCLSLR